MSLVSFIILSKYSSFAVTNKTGTLTDGHLSVDRMILIHRNVNGTDSNHSPCLHEYSPQFIGSIKGQSLLPVILCGSLLYTPNVDYDIFDESLARFLSQPALPYFIQNARDDFSRFWSVFIAERAFDPETMFSAKLFGRTSANMETTSENRSAFISVIKGAPEVLLPRCTNIWVPDFNPSNDELSRQNMMESLQSDHIPFTPQLFEQITRRYRELAANGYRVLVYAFHVGNAVNEGLQSIDVESGIFNFTLASIIAFEDVVHENVRKTVNILQQQGVRVILATGEYPETALSAARQCGLNRIAGFLASGELTLVKGRYLDRIVYDSEALKRVVSTVDVFARSSFCLSIIDVV